MLSRLIGDIGGTHARFALCEPGGEPQDVRKLSVRDYPGLAEAAQAYLNGRRVRDAVVAVACPVVGDWVAFTNSPWQFSIQAVQAALGLERLTAINDFAAQAEAVPHVRAEELRPLKPGAEKPQGPCVVIGPGTGLGVAFLVPEDGGLRVWPSEGGHTSFAPQDARQAAILSLLRRDHGHVSYERVVSGPGLMNIANALAELQGEDRRFTAPQQVSEGGAQGCAISLEALRIFAFSLGAVAGNLALSLLARGGVFIAGGLCRNLGPLLDVAVLSEGFSSKGRFAGYLAEVPITQVMRPHAGLLGAAHFRHD